MHSWQEFLEGERQKQYFLEITRYVENKKDSGTTVYPPTEDVFNAFKYTEFYQVKVVILGQDPYHGPNQAHGLSFSVKRGIKTPPSLLNMYKELEQDIENFTIPEHGHLLHWAKQGVLLLNTVLTVEQGIAHSHAGIGWEQFTDSAIEALNSYAEGVVFLLWGSHAQKKGKMINSQRHHILQAPHPSPLSAYRGFFGCKHFSTANELLHKQGKTPIDWCLTNQFPLI